jgi:hypothetical protein
MTAIWKYPVRNRGLFYQIYIIFKFLLFMFAILIRWINIQSSIYHLKKIFYIQMVLFSFTVKECAYIDGLSVRHDCDFVHIFQLIIQPFPSCRPEQNQNKVSVLMYIFTHIKIVPGDGWGGVHFHSFIYTKTMKTSKIAWIPSLYVIVYYACAQMSWFPRAFESRFEVFF